MQPLRATVRNGHLVLNEPTDLPEGLDDDDRQTLHESIEESIEQMKAGNLVDGDEALAALRAHR